MYYKKTLSTIVAVCLLISVVTVSHVYAAEPVKNYNNYASDAKYSTEAQLPEAEAGGNLPVQLTDSQNQAVLSLDCPEDGWYRAQITYKPGEEDYKNIVLSLHIDDQLPFEEASAITLNREYENAVSEFVVDAAGNQLRPSQKQTNRPLTAYMKNTNGYADDPYLFYMTKGTHTIRLQIISGSVELSRLIFKQAVQTESWENVKNNIQSAGYQPSGARIRLEGEDASYKSEKVLYPTVDKTSAGTSPADPTKELLNTIGQTNWKNPGQTITWEFDVTKPGLYAIALRVKQNQRRGTSTFRRIYIDGVVPCAPFETIAFPYQANWYMSEIRSGEELCTVYLDKGKHTIQMEVVTGPFSQCYLEAQQLVSDLNRAYRSILTVTGASPDPYRDYNLGEAIPGLIDELQRLNNAISDLNEKLIVINGTAGSEASFLQDFILQLDSFIEDPAEIQTRLDAFKSNITYLGTWTGSITQQPLELDYIELFSPELEPPVNDVGFFKTIAYRTQEFLYSFAADYSSIGVLEETVAKRKITVWVNSGRDQTQIIRNMLNDDFTPKTGIQVALNLVPDESTLLQATLAGKGPDAALLVTSALPVNLAKRGAALNLEEFPGFDEVESRVRESAMIKYRYKQGTYAIPSTQSFNMMFYRTDIFEEFGLEPPNTWTDFYKILPVLDHNNLQIGIMPDQLTFEMLLYQHGGTLYTDDLNATNLHSAEALEAFRMWTDLYVKYSLPQTYDFYNRFRTGEMPLGIADYSMYNNISVLAPELRGSWKMVPVPGIETETGINRTVTSDGQASVIMSKAKDPEAAWTFLEWWSTDEIQARFGNELEELLGAIGRYKAANTKVLSMLGWDKESAEALEEQWKTVTAVPQLPSSYDANRNILNSFRAVVYNGKNVRETLSKYAQYMDDEIIRKQKSK